MDWLIEWLIDVGYSHLLLDQPFDWLIDRCFASVFPSSWCRIDPWIVSIHWLTDWFVKWVLSCDKICFLCETSTWKTKTQAPMIDRLMTGFHSIVLYSFLYRVNTWFISIDGWVDWCHLAWILCTLLRFGGIVSLLIDWLIDCWVD